MTTKPKNKKRASALNPSINSKPRSDKKPKPSKLTEEQPEEASAADKQKAKDEISEIFSAAKASKKSKPPQEKEASQRSNRKKSKEGSEEGSNKKRNKTTPCSKGKKRDLYEDGDQVEKRPRRRTADGLAIYSAEELGFGKSNAGSTPLCPFDCDCCF
jgi:hypothetical protein